MTDPAGLRRIYSSGQLGDDARATGWFEQLRDWFDTAVADPATVEANAVQLATVDHAGHPSVRTVLIKAFDEDGIVFYTDSDSPKARDLGHSPYASAVFAWLSQERQVRLSGPVERVTRAEAEAYFATRPRGSQIAAWASDQSSVVESRAALEQRVREIAARFEGMDVPAPPNWGGYRLRPDEVEFWQGRPDRLHDRLRHRRTPTGWIVERLAP